MKIGIDLRRLAPTDTGPAAWVRDALGALFERDNANTYVLFHTVFNYHLFVDRPNVSRRTLSAPRFPAELQDQVTYDGDFDLVVRTTVEDALAALPLARQIICVADGPAGAGPERLDAGRVTARRNLHACLTGAGAVAVPTDALCEQLAADPWTRTDVFAVPAEPVAAAGALLGAFARVLDRATRPAVRVETPPTVSIVTPSFNQGAYIKQTIESVLAQDYPHIDYRVIDGGSDDDTVAVLKSYGDRVKWVSEKDRGQTHAINKGMAQAAGEVRTYLNSDDLLRPGAVGRVVEHFRARPGCDLVYGRDAMIDASGRYLNMYPTAEYSFDRLVENCCISQPAAFWRKRIADRVGPFDESLQLVMDYDYWLRVDRAAGAMEHIPDVLAHTRIHQQSKSSGGGKAESHQRKFYQELFDVSRRHAGYVSSHHINLWLYTTVFNRRPWTRRYQGHILHACQGWHHLRYRVGLSRWRALRALRDGWPRGLPRLLVGHLLGLLDPRRLARRAGPEPVRLEPDLWLGPELTVAHPGGPLYLAGVPARDSVLRVFRGASEVAAVPLRCDEPIEVNVEVPPGPPGTPLRLVFSDAEALPDGRIAAFKLRGTTLFSERDVA
jgi:glycosyltransferase involved in cell wall biosynthesis